MAKLEHKKVAHIMKLFKPEYNLPFVDYMGSFAVNMIVNVTFDVLSGLRWAFSMF